MPPSLGRGARCQTDLVYAQQAAAMADPRSAVADRLFVMRRFDSRMWQVAGMLRGWAAFATGDERRGSSRGVVEAVSSCGLAIAALSGRQRPTSATVARAPTEYACVWRAPRTPLRLRRVLCACCMSSRRVSVLLALQSERAIESV